MSKTKSSPLEWGYELHVLLQEFADKRKLDTAQMLGYLTSSICGTLAMHGYKEEFVKKTLDRMYDHYMQKKKEFDDQPNYLFSEALRSRMSKFNDRELDECLQSREFWEELIKHVGLENDPKIKEIMNRESNHSEKSQSREYFFSELEKVFEEIMPDLVQAFKGMKKE